MASLLLGTFPRVLVRLMVTDQAARTSSEQSVMASIVPRHPADDGTLETAGSGRRRRAQKDDGHRQG
jgi:hypothetical protein